MRRPSAKTRARHVVAASEFKAHCLRLLDEVGDGAEFVITKHGTPIARLSPVQKARRTSYGSWQGLVRIEGDIVHSDWSEDFEATSA